MKKIDKKMLLFGILLCLLPMLIGFYYYDLLPDKIAIHFNMQGNPDNFVSKTWGIVGLPLVMGAVFLVLSIALDIQETGKKGASLVKMIIPIMSILLQGALIYYALDNNFDVGKLTLFTVGIIFMVLGNYLPKKEYWGKYNFNLCGLEKGLDVSVYAKINLDSFEMGHIRNLLEEGLTEIANYVDLLKASYQFSIVADDLRNNIDVSAYLKKDFSWDQKMLIRQGVLDKIYYSMYSNPEYNIDQMLEIKSGLFANVDVSKYSNVNYNWEQMEQIRKGLENKVDISIYAKDYFNSYQMEEIRLGLEDNLNISLYATRDFDEFQMEQIRIGLLNKVDVSVYSKKEFDWEQMKEIRLGLEKNLNVSFYAITDFNNYQMYELRKILERNAIDFSLFENLTEEEAYKRKLELIKENEDCMNPFYED